MSLSKQPAPRSQAPSRQTSVRPSQEEGTPSRDFVRRVIQVREERRRTRCLNDFQSYVEERPPK